MKIRSRFEFFLSKIAGRVFDVDTLIPRGASTAVEELLLEISDRINSVDKGYASIRKIKDYLYEIYYDNIDYDKAYEHYNNGSIPIGGMACTSVRNGDFFGRNFDWIYDDSAEFIVHTKHDYGRNAVIGVAGISNKFHNIDVNNKEYDPLYKVLPFSLRDGINEHGLVMSMNVVPTDKGFNVAEPTGENLVSVSGLMLVRYILDYFSDAASATDFIKEHMTIHFPESLHNMSYEIHYMIADSSHTFLLEVIDNEAVITDMTQDSGSSLDGKPYMTNFYLSDVVFNEDGTVYTPESESGSAIEDNNITANGSGLERYNYIVDNYDTADTADGIRELMNGLTYTKAYITSEHPAEPIWYSEFVGINGLTVDSTPDEFEPVVEAAGNEYLKRSRTGGYPTWHTVHSTVYNMDDKIMTVVSQEDGTEFEFSL